MIRFLARPSVHRFAMLAFASFAALTFSLLLSGCASPVWLTDATSIIPVLISSAASVLAFVAALTGATVPAAILAQISTWSTNVENGLKEIENLIAEYNVNKSDTLLVKIETAVQLVVTDLNKILTVSGIPTAIAAKLQAFAQLILTELEAWATLIPTLKSANQKAGTKLTLTIPRTKADFKKEFNAILAKTTGDAAIDAALAKAKKI